MSQVEANATIESIFSGYKFVHRDDVTIRVSVLSRTSSLADACGARHSSGSATEAGRRRRLLAPRAGQPALRRRRPGGRRRRAARARLEPPDGTLVLDGGTLGLSLLPYLEDARDVILVDAIRADEPPGTLVRLRATTSPRRLRHRLSPHQIGVADLLDGARLARPLSARLVLARARSGDARPRHRPLAGGRSRLPELVDEIVAEARRLGHAFVPRPNRSERLSGSRSCRSRLRPVGAGTATCRAPYRDLAIPGSGSPRRGPDARPSALSRALRSLPRRRADGRGVRREGLTSPPARLHRPGLAAPHEPRGASSSRSARDLAARRCPPGRS